MIVFRAKHFCVECEKELTHNQRMDSNGVCPHCGYTSVGTICDTVKRSVEVKEPQPPEDRIIRTKNGCWMGLLCIILVFGVAAIFGVTLYYKLGGK